MQDKEGFFIAFEGGEGSGKSTQAQLLYDKLISKGWPALLTKEPGGDDGVCKDIRTVLLNPKYKGNFDPMAELLLFLADRAQHVNQVIRPALLDEGKIVVCDRYEASTYAYQINGRGVVTSEDFRTLSLKVTSGHRGGFSPLRPNLTFWLDIDPKIGLQRNIDAKKRNRFEMEDISFHEKVRDGFVDYFNNAEKKNWKKLDATKPIEELHKEVMLKMADLLKSDADLLM